MKAICNPIYRLSLSILVLLCAVSMFEIKAQTVESFVTKADKSELMSRQTETAVFTIEKNERQNYIIVDPRQRFQPIEGFGFALTGGSAQHILAMEKAQRSKLLRELFDSSEGIGISCIRLTLGASDLNGFVFSYDDMVAGETDFDLQYFSLAQDLKDVIPVMKEILEINPNIEIMSSPWSAPAWMKTNGNSHGGKLRKDCYDVYARYFVRYVEEMKRHGINVKAVTIQNESLNSGNTPSMPWTPDEQAEFIKNYLGPLFVKSGIETKIIIFDHNTDRPDYPLTIYNDPAAANYVVGSAFHNYRGDLSAMSFVHESRPDKNVYFTEQMTINNPADREIAIAPAVARLIIGITRNWSRNVILWNLAANSENEPHTDNGGCTMCQGAVTIDGDSVTSRNIAYYVIAHASKFVPVGSIRIASTAPWDRTIALCEDEQAPRVFRANIIEHSNVVPNVAFLTPEGKIVLIVANDSWSRRKLDIQYNGKFVELNITPGSVATYIWEA